jgi:zinc and cadmium transporter
MTLTILIIAALAGSLLSFLGGILLLNKRISRDRLMLYAMPFAAGAFLGAAFLTVLPEALFLAGEQQHIQEVRHSEEGHHTDEDPHAAGDDHTHDEALITETTYDEGGEAVGGGSGIFIWALVGFVLFFLLERSIRWFHRHHEHAGDNSHKSLIVIGDTVHNAIDGAAIGAAFLVSIPLGIATTVAVAAHELPQEIGDFGILLSKGMKRGKVLMVNIISGLATVTTAVLTFSLGDAIEAVVPALLAVVAGYFIYVAAADIIPDIHEQPHKRANLQAALLLAGILIIPLVGVGLTAFGLEHTH